MNQIPYNYLVDIIKKLLKISFNIYSDYKESHILKLFLVEEFEKVCMEQLNLQKEMQDTK